MGKLISKLGGQKSSNSIVQGESMNTTKAIKEFYAAIFMILLLAGCGYLFLMELDAEAARAMLR